MNFVGVLGLGDFLCCKVVCVCVCMCVCVKTLGRYKDQGYRK